MGWNYFATEEASAQKILDYTRERAGEGLELPIEVTRGELTMAKIDHQILQLSDRNDILTGQLRDQLGYPDSVAIQVSPEELPATAEESVAALENVALENSIDVERAGKRAQRPAAFVYGAARAIGQRFSSSANTTCWRRYNNYSEFFRSFSRTT